MADITTDVNQSRAMRIARKRVEGFAEHFGEAHHNLVRHAAFPLVLTPDLLYQIWANFVPEAPWVAVAHVLLSRLCRQVGYEMYEIDIADRNLLLRGLKEEFGQERYDELGEFLLDYVAQRLTDDDADTQDLREAQEWTALAYTKPDEVAQELAQRLGEMVQQEDMGEVLRLASLVDTLSEPLMEAGFKPLLIYSKAMVAVSDSEQQDTASQLRKLISASDQQLSRILCYLYQIIDQDTFFEFVNDNYDSFEDAELLLTAIYNHEYLDFESFVDLAIQTLKPDFDGKVYVKYNKYYSTRDEGERIIIPFEQAVQMHLLQVPEFITENDGESLGVILRDEQNIEMVLAILTSGEYEFPDSDIEDGTVKISIIKPELLEDHYEEDEVNLDFGETVESTKHKILVEPDKKILTTKELPTGENNSTSEQRKSSTVNFTSNTESTTNQLSSPSSTNTILIVDDSRDNLFLIKILLEEEGYEVNGVGNGIDALSMIETSPPDLIVLDLMMPGMDGYEVTKRIRANTTLPFIPILLISAYDSPNVAHGLDLGANDFIRKPVTVDELLARVRNLLRMKVQIREQINNLTSEDKINSQQNYLNKLINFIYSDTTFIETFIESELSDKISGEKVTSALIPSDNNEGTIDEAGEIKEIDLNPNSFQNYNDYFEISFSLEVDCQVTYLIYKADYYAMEDEESFISILDDDWNDHYSYAGQYYLLKVEGIVSVYPTFENIDNQNISDDELYEIIENAQIHIDSLSKIEIVEND